MLKELSEQLKEMLVHSTPSKKRPSDSI
jgi:hypothetical protein